MLWIAIALMTGAAVLCVVWPLSKPRAFAALPSDGDIAFYEDQLRALDRDVDSGLVPSDEVARSRTEIGRRVIAAHARAEASPPVRTTARWRLLVTALAVILVIPAVSLAVYLRVGAPDQDDMPLSARRDSPISETLAQDIAKVETHLITHPDDGRGFDVLAPLYLRIGRFDAASQAYSRALTLLGESVSRRVGYGQALMLAADGVVTADAREAFEQAAKDDPTAPQPKFYLGLAAAEDGDKARARTIWNGLVASAPADAPWLPLVKTQLSELDNPTAAPRPPASGPASPAGAAIAALPADQRLGMIRGMVEGLASRLAQDGHDKEGWLKLVRAYAVLGEKDRALAALADGRKNLSADPQALAALTGLAHELGLES